MWRFFLYGYIAISLIICVGICMLIASLHPIGCTIEKDIKHMFILSIIIIAMHINVIIPVYIIAF